MAKRLAGNAMSAQRHPIPRDSSWILATVLDIRSFTELTARVDEISRAVYIAESKRIELLQAYRCYVADTQRLAREELLKVAHAIRSPWAMKPTGDGLLFAIQLQDLAIEAGVTGGGQVPGLAPLQQQAVEKIIKTVSAIASIVADSHVGILRDNDAPSVGLKTGAFLKRYGGMLGYDPEEARKEKFLLAGACAIGIGDFTTQEDPTFGCRWRTDVDRLRHVDANGHAVNLAFRLCGEAARLLDKGIQELSPAILLQRQLVHFVTSFGSVEWQAAVATQPVKTLVAYQLRREMKGVEDRWCYGLHVGAGSAQR